QVDSPYHRGEAQKAGEVRGGNEGLLRLSKRNRQMTHRLVCPMPGDEIASRKSITKPQRVFFTRWSFPSHNIKTSRFSRNHFYSSRQASTNFSCRTRSIRVERSSLNWQVQA